MVRNTAPGGRPTRASRTAVRLRWSIASVMSGRGGRASLPPSSSAGPSWPRRPVSCSITSGPSGHRASRGTGRSYRYPAAAGPARGETPRRSANRARSCTSQPKILGRLHGHQRLAAGAAGHHHRIEGEVAQHLAELTHHDGVAQHHPAVLLGAGIGVGRETATEERGGTFYRGRRRRRSARPGPRRWRSCRRSGQRWVIPGHQKPDARDDSSSLVVREGLPRHVSTRR